MNPFLTLARSLPLLAISVGICASAALGQEATSSKTPETSLRVNLLPVGDFPVSGAVIKNGMPVVVTPPPSELIPAAVSIKVGKDYQSFALSMNSPTKQWALTSGSEVDVLAEKDGQYSHYLKVRLPEVKEDVTVFMLRNQQSRDWQKEPATFVFKNGIETFPLGSVRLINFSSAPLQVKIGEVKGIIAPKSQKVIPAPGMQGGNVFFPYQISVKINGVERSLANTATSYDAKSRMNLVAYDRDGKSEIRQEGDDQPVKLVKYFELPYSAPAPVAPVPNPATPAAVSVTPAPPASLR